jgi:hypothetical protein
MVKKKQEKKISRRCLKGIFLTLAIISFIVLVFLVKTGTNHPLTDSWTFHQGMLLPIILIAIFYYLNIVEYIYLENYKITFDKNQWVTGKFLSMALAFVVLLPSMIVGYLLGSIVVFIINNLVIVLITLGIMAILSVIGYLWFKLNKKLLDKIK